MFVAYVCGCVAFVCAAFVRRRATVNQCVFYMCNGDCMIVKCTTHVDILPFCLACHLVCPCACAQEEELRVGFKQQPTPASHSFIHLLLNTSLAPFYIKKQLCQVMMASETKKQTHQLESQEVFFLFTCLLEDINPLWK